MSIEPKEYQKSNFSFAFFFLNKDRKNALSVFYKFARLVDDITDSELPPKTKKEKLDEIKRRIDSIYSGENQNDNFWKEVFIISKKYSIPKCCFDQLIEGMIFDLRDIDIKTLKELEQYMYMVASVVGMAVLKISGYDGNDAEEISRYTGYAVQLTNILRDIDEDIKRNRIYIPLEHRLNICGTSKINLETSKIKTLMEFERKLAYVYYTKADFLFKKNKSKKLFTAALMKNIYREILNGLDFDNIPKNNKISFYKKLKVFWKSFIETMI